jgi:hypothetical protein
MKLSVLQAIATTSGGIHVSFAFRSLLTTNAELRWLFLKLDVAHKSYVSHRVDLLIDCYLNMIYCERIVEHYEQ